MSCCPSGAAPYLAADHTDEGSVRSMDGIAFYQVGKGPNGLLLCPDVWGWNGGRTRAIADDLAKKGLSVWVPKVLTPAFEGGTDGEALPPTFDVGVRGSELGPLLAGDWNQAKVVPKLKAVIKAMKAAGVKRIGLLGFCYGAWVGMHLAAEVELVGCASPHPSVHIEKMLGGDVEELAKRSKCPWALFPADGDAPELYDKDGTIIQALEAKFKNRNVTKRYEGQKHGFVSRGAIKDGQFKAGDGDDVKAAVEACITDICEFFVRCRLMRRKEAGLPPPPVKLRAPRFHKVAKIQPEANGLNLNLKVVSCKATDDKSWEAVLGDESGVVTFSLKRADQAELCKVGSFVRVQNARVIMIKGYIRVIVDKWGVMKEGEAPEGEFEVKTDKDVSATEYELAG